MKRRVFAAFLAILSLACAVGCGEEEHRHSTANVWNFDGTHHWKNATCEHEVKVGYAEHTLDESGCCTVCQEAIEPTDGVVYELSDDGAFASVISYTGTAKRVKIDDSFEGAPVKVIGVSAFEKAEIVAVEIPDSVISIGEAAFKFCKDLTRVTIGDGVVTVEKYAFYFCGNLTELVVGASVASILDSAFRGCDGLTELYYKGDSNGWMEIKSSWSNSPLLSANRHFYSENPPMEGGKYWRYVDGVPTVWTKE